MVNLHISLDQLEIVGELIDADVRLNTDGLEAALSRAKAAAGGKDVRPFHP